MQVRVAGAIPMVDVSGDVMDRSDAVTLFNHMCLLAPGTLVSPDIAWETIDARTVRARFTNRKETIAATLLFSDDGLLTNFLSDDRSRSSADGKVFTRLRFSTPVRDYRDWCLSHTTCLVAATRMSSLRKTGWSSGECDEGPRWLRKPVRLDSGDRGTDRCGDPQQRQRRGRPVC